MKFSNALIFPADSLKNYLERKFSLPKLKFKIPFISLPKNLPEINEKEIDNEVKRIVHIGRINDELKYIFLKLNGVIDKIEFVFIGTQINNEINFINRFKRIKILPTIARNNIFKWLNISNLFIVNYDKAFKTIPSKLVDYMYAGKPIIVNDFESLKEILSDDEAYIIKNDFRNNAVKIAKKILEEGSDGREIKAKKKAIDLFSYNIVLNKLKKALEEVLNKF